MARCHASSRWPGARGVGSTTASPGSAPSPSRNAATRYVPLLPYVHAALDRVAAFLEGEGALPGDAVVEPTPRAPGQRLEAWHLAIP
jgi:hypothetical protein